MNKNKIWLGMAVLITVGMVVYFVSVRNVSPKQFVFDPKNATYEIEGIKINLVNGEAQVETVPGSASKTTIRYFGNEAEGDLNGDGLKDKVFLITQDGGGSGLFYYAVVALKNTDGYKITNSFFIGDRIAPQTTEIRDNKLIVNYAERPVGAPMTERPSMGVSRYLEVVNSKLVESAK
jgi:hypothetical protein